MRLNGLVGVMSSLWMMVYASTSKEDYEVCHRACSTDFLPQISGLVSRERVYSDFEGLLPSWSTCQYRCYRCRIPGANLAMKNFKKMFDENRQNAPRVIVDIARFQWSITRSLEDTCYTPWRAAIRSNDTVSTF
ncbi:hypothetical protein INT47_010051 [Mucor saturninus]|uniref:Uncharacterized protein n=1 Tax=Mucor saturninus TaxID=64648 RepID=A0A8H7QHJ9_9FUNG|nr:hypothetical protein INT47_010051 [Mucor saturninus]